MKYASKHAIPFFVMLLVGAALAGQLGIYINSSGSFARPNDTTTYASGDLVANSTTNTNVVPVDIQVGSLNAQVAIERIKLQKSATNLANAQFRVHLYRATPATISAGDNGAFGTSAASGDLGMFDITMGQTFTDGASGFVLPGANAIVLQGTNTIKALIEARAAYVPTANETFTLSLESVENQ